MSDQSKAFKGRLGNIDTRVATLNKSYELEKSGLTVDFEYQVMVSPKKSRYLDVVSFDDNMEIVDYIQFVKVNRRKAANGKEVVTIIRADEYIAALEIENAKGLPRGTVEILYSN